ncbi:MAG: taurine ABC transporter substrate-binding protein [Alkaliphilus sp.]|nr:MAG: taurine ABC transporter substrate-binding protein [Alkaliphilus sp.]
MKKIFRLLFIMMLVLALAVGCAQTEKTETEGEVQETEKQEEVVDSQEEIDAEEEKLEPITVSVAAPAGAPTLSMIRMFKHNPSLGESVEVSYESVKSPDLMAARMISGEVDIAVVPSNLAIKLYNKEVEFTFAGASVWGVLYIVSTEEDVSTWEDLKGKEINMLGRGLTPDIITRFLMKENGIIPDEDVRFNYVAGGAGLAQLLIAGESNLSILPEPTLTKVLMKQPKARVILDLQEEWAKATGSDAGYPQAVLVISNELIESRPDVVANFLREYEAGIKWLNENPEQAGNYSEELQLGLNAKIVTKSIERSNIMFKNAKDSKEAIMQYYKILHGFSPEVIGGKLPDEGFFLQQ